MPEKKDWIEMLDEQDRAFLKRFVLASGSLKDLAATYGVSYPTIRLRLDRLIAKIEIYDRQTPLSDFERLVRSLHIDGKIDQPTLKLLLAAHTSAQDHPHDSNHPATADAPVDRSLPGTG
jgi:Protein of unknown function (DUF2089)